MPATLSIIVGFGLIAGFLAPHVLTVTLSSVIVLAATIGLWLTGSLSLSLLVLFCISALTLHQAAFLAGVAGRMKLSTRKIRELGQDPQRDVALAAAARDLAATAERMRAVSGSGAGRRSA